MWSDGKRSAVWLLGATLWVVLVDLCTNSISPAAQHDSIYYLAMAQNGVLDDEAVAPFAYRPLVPGVVHGLHWLTGVDVETSFYWLTRSAAVALLVSVAALAFTVARRAQVAWLAMAVAAMSFHVVKVPLFWHTLVDVEACLVMVWAVHAHWTGRWWWCVALSAVGVLMKEFVLIPGLLCVVMPTRTPRPIAHRLVAAAALALAVLAPRWWIPVVATLQFVDPAHDSGLLSQLWRSLSPERGWRVAFSVVGMSMPVILLSTRARWARLAAVLAGDRLWGLGFLGLVVVLSLLGGSDMPRFALYLLPLLVLALAAMFGGEPPSRGVVCEWLVVAVAMVVFNRLWIGLPDPTLYPTGYAHVFGGHADTLVARMFDRSRELVALCAFGGALNHVVRQRFAVAARNESPAAANQPT